MKRKKDGGREEMEKLKAKRLKMQILLICTLATRKPNHPSSAEFIVSL